ncbi:MAG: biotin--[acetyl-CoA-carboxylase] ligase [bacterium]
MSTRSTKKILNTLKSKTKGFVSGEQLGTSLKISRTAIWKSVERLRSNGYKIEAHKKEGYRLLGIPDSLLPQEIQYALRTKFVGKKIHYFKKIPSTNEHAKRFAAQGASEGTVVIAEMQTRGKGRLGKQWVSPAGGIWMSVVLRPSCSPQEAIFVTMIATLAARDAIEDLTGLKAFIKWPNDVMLKVPSRKKSPSVLRKVCGVLTEMAAEVGRVNYLVVGMGLNVNNELPRFLEDIACSLCERSHEVDRLALTKSILEKFEYYYLLFLKEGPGSILRQVRKYSAILDKTVRVDLPGGSISAKALRITDRGTLVLKMKNGTKKDIIAGEVSLGT